MQPLNANAYDIFQLQCCKFNFKRYEHICKDGMEPYAFLLYAFYWLEVWGRHLVRLEKWCYFLLSWLSGKTFSEGGTHPGSDLNINVVRWDGKLLVWRRKNVWGKPPAGQRVRDEGRKEGEDLSLAPPAISSWTLSGGEKLPPDVWGRPNEKKIMGW